MNKYISNYELWTLSLSVEDMQDFALVDELALYCQEDFMYNIIYTFITVGRLTEKERASLIDYYVLYNSMEVDDE